ncbi:MAG: ASCH domain-containing protein [Phycisphaerae bacterium]
MKALTICQPYAELIIRGEKPVENRRWYTEYRGPLLIHAGKSRDWLELDSSGTRDEAYDIPLAEMDFGAIIGKVDLIDCVPLTRLRSRDGRCTNPKYRVYANSPHAEGPFCLLLAEPVRFSAAVPARGFLGLFDVPGELEYRSPHVFFHPAGDGATSP